MVLGGGPNRIGQGIEFDYCCVHAALAMREDGYETIMVNCNPETVSTDYDTSDRLYFEPLTLEDVLEIVASRKTVRRDRAVRRPDAAEAGARPGSERRADHRHHAGHDRRRRRPRALPAAAARPRPAAAAEPHRAHRGRGHASGGTKSAIRWWCAQATCWAGGRWKSSTSRRDLERYMREAVKVSQRFAGAARPLPERCDRGRCGCLSDGTRTCHRRHHGAHRTGRRAFRRLGLFVAAVFAVAGDQDELQRQTVAMAKG